MAAELLKNYEAEIASLRLIPSDGGRFEVSVDGELLYSKLETRRHAEAGEIRLLVQRYLEREK